MNRFRELEKLQAATRAELPRVAVAWLAAARAPLEKRDCNVLHRICQQIDYYVKEHKP